MDWQSLFLVNRWQKLFALGLAVLIWFTVRSTEGLRLADDAEDGTRTFSNVPIVVLTSAADLGRYEVTPSSVRVDLQGDPQTLRNIAPNLIEAYVNLVNLGTTPQTLEIHINPPPDTDLVALTPAKVLVDRLSESPHQKPPP